MTNTYTEVVYYWLQEQIDDYIQSQLPVVLNIVVYLVVGYVIFVLGIIGALWLLSLKLWT